MIAVMIAVMVRVVDGDDDERVESDLEDGNRRHLYILITRTRTGSYKTPLLDYLGRPALGSHNEEVSRVNF